MAIVGSTLVSAVGAATTGSVTPGANSLVVAAKVVANSGGDPSHLAPGNAWGVVWVQIGTTIDAPGGLIGISLWRGMATSPTAGTVTWSDEGADSGSCLSIVQFSGVDTSGSQGSGAIVQSKTAASNTVTLNSAIIAGNATFGGFAGSGTLMVPGSGYTQLHLLANGTDAGDMTEWRADGNTVVAANAFATAVAALEIKAAAASAFPYPQSIGPF